MSRQDLPAPEEKTEFVRAMFDSIAHRYDLVNSLITLGLDRRWRRRAISKLELASGSLVLDLGCGTGDLVREAKRATLNCIGLDLSFEMLLAARAIRAPVIEADAQALPISRASIDGVISGFALRNFSDPIRVFQEVARVLVPGGRLVILEVDRPSHFALRFGHRIWFNRVVPVIGAFFSDGAAYRYLPKSVAYLPNTVDLKAMLVSSGFGDISYQRLHGGLAQVIVAVKEGEQQ